MHLEFLPLERQLFLVEHYLHYCQRIIRDKQAEAQVFAKSPSKQEHMSSPFRERALAFMQLKTDQWQLEVAWVQSLCAHVVARLQQEGTSSWAPHSSELV